MGALFALAPIDATSPNYVEGLCHWIERDKQNVAQELHVMVIYWQDSVMLATEPMVVKRKAVIKAGGTLANWVALAAAGFNSSDTDDVVQILAASDWGKKMLWALWKVYVGRSMRA